MRPVTKLYKHPSGYRTLGWSDEFDQHPTHRIDSAKTAVIIGAGTALTIGLIVSVWAILRPSTPSPTHP